MEGTLVKYSPHPSHLAFITPAKVQGSSTSSSSSRHVILVGGLTEGLMYASYVPLLAEALSGAGWHVVQAQISSSYTGWGCGSLDRDADELLLLCRWLVQHRSASALLLLGHSTGCNDIVRLMQKAGAQGLLPSRVGDAPSEGQLPIVGTILQATGSDNEMFSVYPGLDKAAARAQQMIAAGQGAQVVMRMPQELTYGAPVSASRLVSLHSPQGDDDMFSSALTDTQLKVILEPVGVRSCLVLASGADELVPPPYNGLDNITRQANRVATAISTGGRRALVEVFEGANHSLDGREKEVAAIVMRFVGQGEVPGLEDDA